VLNLSLRPFRNDNLYRLIYACCVGVLLAASVGNLALLGRHGWALASLSGGLQAQRQALAEREERERDLGRRLAGLDGAALQRRADFANAAILSRVFSWTTLFNELEEVVPPDVKLRSLRPSIGARGKVDVLLEGTARDYGAFVELEEALMRSSSFSRVYPGSERLQSAPYQPGAPPLPGAARPAGVGAAAGGAGGGELAFSISFEYFPGGKPAARQGAASDAGGTAGAGR
jgi:Tfp pilus assembly protein PilN